MEGCCITYTMTIIDTPGFGDTEGLKNDELITKQTKEFFSLKGEHRIDHLDGIGFVTQSSSAHLTHTQQYIFDSILAIFGSDVAENIFLMVTFADGQKPPVIAAVKEANIPFSHFFMFNNSALFTATKPDDEEDNFNEMFWKMGTASFKKFFHEFEQAECVSLLLTKDVLNGRQKLETIIQGLQKQVKACMAEMEVLRQERQVLKDHESDIAANKKFTYKIKVPKIITHKLEGRQYVTNCLNCSFTCHFPCGIPDDGAKYRCAAMDSRDKSSAECKACPGHCSWTQHKNTRERFELTYVMETRNHDNLKNKYEVASSRKATAEEMIASSEQQLESAHAQLLTMTEEAQQCVEKLGKIALKPSPLTQVEYIQLLIESEKE